MVAILISAIWKTHAPTSETEPSRGTRRAQFAKISWRTCCRGKSILYSIYNTRENRLCLIKFTVLYISLQIKCKTFTIVHVWIKVCIYGETHNVWDKIFQSLPIVCMLLSLLIIPFFFLVLWWKNIFIINNRILCFVLIGCWNGKLNGMEISPKRTLI